MIPDADTPRIGGTVFPRIPPVTGSAARPFWSVVVPVYNRTRYLRECLECVLAQWPGAAEMEILVVDDASTEPVAPLLAELGHAGVAYHRNACNLGLPGNWNSGIARARGQWIHLLHDDDLVLPGFYARLREALRAAPASVGAAFTGFENIDGSGKLVFRKAPPAAVRGVARNALASIAVQNQFNMCAVVVRRETYESLGAYHPELTYTSDWEFYQRIAVFRDWWCEPPVLARYRMHDASMTNRMFFDGSYPYSMRRAIEIAQGYLPPQRAAELGAKARARCSTHCRKIAGELRKRGKLAAAERLLEEAANFETAPAMGGN